MRRPDNEPLLFDLPLDRPARDDEAEPVLDRQPERPARSDAPPRAPGQARPSQATERAPSPAGPPTAPVSPATVSAPRSAAPRPPAAPLSEASLQRLREGQDAHPDRTVGAGLADPLPPAGARRAAGRLETASLPFYATATAAGGTLEKPSAKPKAGSGRVGIGRRLAAGAADLLVHLAVAVLALAGCRYLGVVPALRDWPALAVFLLSFSFLYTVVPLAFWGRTLGMTWAGLTAESTEGEPLSFDQTARRWLGALLTLATLGLALLLALTGRSLSDRLSGSRTLPA
jgi:uncharacterized RDD family membrane protein YckC